VGKVVAIPDAMPLNKWNRSGSSVELFEGPSKSALADKTHYTSTFAQRHVHPRPPASANIDMSRSETEWSLTNKGVAGSFSTSGHMPSPGVVYRRHELPDRTASHMQLTHKPEANAQRELSEMYRTTNSAYDDSGFDGTYTSNARDRFRSGDNLNTRCHWDRTASKVRIGGGSAEILPSGTISASHATSILTDHPQASYHAAANGHGRHPPPKHVPTVDLSHDPNAVVVGGKGNGGPDFRTPLSRRAVELKPYAEFGGSASGDFSTHNQGTYGNPGKAAIAHAFNPREHLRSKGEWRMPHNDGSLLLEPQFGSSADTVSVGFYTRSAQMAEAERAVNGPRDLPRRYMWDRTVATVPMKGGDGANNTVAAHSAFVHTGAQLELAPGEVRPKVVPRGTVDRCTSMVMMTSAAAGTANVTGKSKYRDDFDAGVHAASATVSAMTGRANLTIPVRNTSKVPMKYVAGTNFHRGSSDYDAAFAKPQRKDYHRRLDTAGLGTSSRVSLSHDAKTIW